MKDTVRLSLVQLNSKWLDRATNAARMAEYVRIEVAENGADLVVFPELATTGYLEPETDREFVERLLRESEPVPGPTTRLLSEAAAAHGTHVVFGVSRLHPSIEGVLYNSAVLIGPGGTVLGVHDKVHPARIEKGYYVAGNTTDVIDTMLGKVSMQICYDVRFPELARVQALKGAEIIISIWSSWVQPNRQSTKSIVARCVSRAMENNCYFAACNRSGREGDRLYYGGSGVAGPNGEVLGSTERDDEIAVRAELSREVLLDMRMYFPVFRDRRPELYGLIAHPM